ncbi:MAG: hypothetical protein ACLTWK_00435 [Eisenbergiella sp.]
MTNREEYAKKILDIVCGGHGLAVKDKIPCKCTEIECDQCDLHGYGRCREKFTEWCNSEYVEPLVDWSKVPVDTPILVRDSKNDKWIKRHFSKYEGGEIWAYRDGTTSWANNGIYCWTFGKLVTDDELNANSILRADRRKEK